MLDAELKGVVSYMIRTERKHLDKREKGLVKNFGEAADLSKIETSRERLKRLEEELEL